MVSKSILSLLIFFLFLGSIFAIRFKIRNYFLNFFLNSILISIFLSWILISLIIIFNFKINIFLLSFFLVIVFLFYNRNISLKTHLGDKREIYFFLYSILLIIIISLNYVKSHYSFTFNMHDALAWWNQFAINIFEKNYKGNIGYPILFPGLWSLIYISQGNADFWLFSKISLLISPIILLTIIANFYYLKKFTLSIYGLLIFIIFYLFDPLKSYTLSGYMDVPLSIFTFSSLLLMTYYILEKKLSDYKLRIFQIALITGLAMIIKQAGIFLLIVFGYFLFFLNKKKLSKIDYLNIFIVIFTPFLFYLINDFQFINFELLKSLKSQSNQSLEVANFKNYFLQNFLHITKVYNPILFIFLLYCSISTFFKTKKDKIDRFCIFNFLIFCFLLIFYSVCCSYDYRGIIVSSPFLFISSYQRINLIFLKTITYKKNSILDYSNFKNLFVIFFVVINLILIFLPKNVDNLLTFFNDEKKKQIVNYEQSKRIYNSLYKSECGILISNESLLNYNPHIILLENRFNFVNNINLDKIKNLPKCDDSHFVWFAYWTPRNNQEWNKMIDYLQSNNFKTIDDLELIYKSE